MILFLVLKYSLILFIVLLLLFGLYIFYTCNKIGQVLEGNIDLDDYKMNFVGILNKNIKTSLKEDLLYDSILDNFTKLVHLMDKAEGKIPPNQMCIGELGDWTDCSKECGRGKKTRRFNERQKAGETGIPCIYDNGQIESTECYERLCKFSEECEYDEDCISGLCSENEKICTYPHMCARDQLYNCNFDQCQELNRRFREYEYDDMKQRCINKSTDITYTDFEINKKTIDLVKGVKQEEQTQNKKAVLNGLSGPGKCIGVPKSIEPADGGEDAWWEADKYCPKFRQNRTLLSPTPKAGGCLIKCDVNDFAREPLWDDLSNSWLKEDNCSHKYVLDQKVLDYKKNSLPQACKSNPKVRWCSGRVKGLGEVEKCSSLTREGAELKCHTSYEHYDDKNVIPCIWDYSESTVPASGVQDPAALGGTCKAITDNSIKYGGFYWDDLNYTAPKEQDNFSKERKKNQFFMCRAPQ